MKLTLLPLIVAPLSAPALALVAPKLPTGLGLEKRQTQCSMLPCEESTAILCNLLNCGTCEGGVCTGTPTEDFGADSDFGSAASDLTASLGSSGSIDLTGLTGLTGAVPSTLPIDLSALTGSSVPAAGASTNSFDSTALTSSIPSSLPIDPTALSGSIPSPIPIDLTGLTGSVGSTASTDSIDSTALAGAVSSMDST
ncbi:hypothetical protein BDV10DRAFT_186695 [Aspergillus recurvatus]